MPKTQYKTEQMEIKMDGSTAQEIVVTAKENNVALVSESGTLMNLIATLALDPDPNAMMRLEKLISMKNDMDNRQAKLAYARDYAAMKGKLPKIIKNQTNDHTNSDYADLAQINEAVDPILADFGFATTQKVISQTENSITIRAEILHRDGHSESMDITFPIDNKGPNGTVNKTMIQGMSSTISYLKRVAKCTILDIAAGDDNDGNVTKKETKFISIEQAAEIDMRVRALGTEYHKRFMTWIAVTTIPEILDINYKRIITAIAAAEKEVKAMKESKARVAAP